MSKRETVSKPGFYTMAAADYHADPAPWPSLSSSLVPILLYRSPLHAKFSHPRLSPELNGTQHSGRMEVGDVAHQVLLGAGRGMEVIDAADWRTKDAKEAREAAYSSGKTPILKHQADEVHTLVEAARRQVNEIAACDFAIPGQGKAETVAIWQEPGGVWCRSMFDWLSHDGVIWDYKTTGLAATPDGITRRICDVYELQAALYSRGYEALTGSPPKAFRFVFQETDPPYSLAVFELDGGFAVIGRKKVEAAIELWGNCLAEDHWPGYPAEIQRLHMPEWHESRWLAREVAEEAAQATPAVTSFDPNVLNAG